MSLSPEVRRWMAGISVEERFLAVDEIEEGYAALARRNPEGVRTRRIGTSRLGEPLLLTSIGSGAQDALIVSGVHPNEVACFHTAAQLARLALDDDLFHERFDYTWHFVHDLDPDGTRLNERWFDRPGDFEAYMRDFFRPAPEAQPEWTFPTSYKRAHFDRMLPESQALARVIDEIRPELYVSLHGSEAGGAYWYVSQWDEQLLDDLHAVADAAGIDVDRGEAESAHLTRIVDGVYLASRFAADYDAAEAAGDDPAVGFLGSSSTEYAAARGATTLIPEVPYWSPIDASPRETDEQHAAMIARTADDLGHVADRLDRLLRDVQAHMTIPSPFWSAAQAFIPMIVEDAAADRRRAATAAQHRPATVAETASRETRVRGFVLRYGGMFRRALHVQVEAGLGAPPVRDALNEMTALLEQWLQRGEPVPQRALAVRSMVALQIGSVMVVADELARRRTRPVSAKQEP